MKSSGMPASMSVCLVARGRQSPRRSIERYCWRKVLKGTSSSVSMRCCSATDASASRAHSVPRGRRRRAGRAACAGSVTSGAHEFHASRRNCCAASPAGAPTERTRRSSPPRRESASENALCPMASAPRRGRAHSSISSRAQSAKRHLGAGALELQAGLRGPPCAAGCARQRGDLIRRVGRAVRESRQCSREDVEEAHRRRFDADRHERSRSMQRTSTYSDAALAQRSCSGRSPVRITRLLDRAVELVLDLQQAGGELLVVFAAEVVDARPPSYGGWGLVSASCSDAP